MTLYPFLELEAGSVPFGPNFRNLTFGEPSSGFTSGPGSASKAMFLSTSEIEINLKDP